MRGIELRKETCLSMMKLYKDGNNHRITLAGWRWWQCKHWEEFSAGFGAKFRNGGVMVATVPVHWLLSRSWLFHSTFVFLVVSAPDHGVGAGPIVFALGHSTFDWSISRKATPLVCTLNRSTFDWSISRKAALLVFTLNHSTFDWSLSASWANPFSVCLNHFVLFCAVLQTRAELFAFELV